MSILAGREFGDRELTVPYSIRPFVIIDTKVKKAAAHYFSC